MGWEGNLTHRQYLAWLAWDREQMNYPDLTQMYLMQIAAEIRRGNVKSPRSVQIEHMRLKFKAERDKKQPSTPKLSKAAWCAAVGIPLSTAGNPPAASRSQPAPGGKSKSDTPLTR